MTESNSRREVILMGFATTAGANVFGARLLYSVADALSLAGGQNPRSDHRLAARLVEALNAQSTVVSSSYLNGPSI